MKTKLIITENQYNLLNKFIIESRYDEFIKNSIRKGDVLRIHWRDNVNTFKVVDALNGQIQMDNIDDGSININYRYLISQTSLNDKTLEVKRVHKLNQKDKLKNPSSWETGPITDIKDIQLIRNGNVIDSVDELGGSETHSEKIQDELSDVLSYILENTNEGDVLTLETKNLGILNLNCVGASRGNYTFESDDDSLSKWDSFNLIINFDGEDGKTLQELNPKTIISNDNGETYNLKFTVKSGEQQSDFWIKGITDLNIKNSDYTNDTEGTEIPSTDDAKKMMHMILNDPLMKKAFYNQPTLWNVIVSAVKGEKPRGTGIVSAREIIGNYQTNKIRKKIGPNAENFKYGKSATFNFIEQNVSMNPTGQLSDKLELPITSTFRAVVQKYKLNDNNLVLASSQPKFKLIIKKEIEGIPDAFEVEVVKEVKSKLGIKTYTQPAKVRFISTQGTGYYNNNKTDTTQQIKTN